jgi:hypothetical protein
LPFRNDPPRNEFLLKLFFGWRCRAGCLHCACSRFGGEKPAHAGYAA